MNEKQRKMVKKLNDDNKKLNDLHKSWIELSKLQILVGICFVIAIIVIIYLSK